MSSVAVVHRVVTFGLFRYMLHDPSVYADPMEFNPDRFLPREGKEPEPDPRDVCFGFGRR